MSRQPVASTKVSKPFNAVLKVMLDGRIGDAARRETARKLHQDHCSGFSRYSIENHDTFLHMGCCESTQTGDCVVGVAGR